LAYKKLTRNESNLFAPKFLLLVAGLASVTKLNRDVVSWATIAKSFLLFRVSLVFSSASALVRLFGLSLLS
jgi:hypothetical protein